MPVQIRTALRDDKVTVGVQGSLDLSLASAVLNRVFGAEASPREVILDLGEVDTVFESGLAALLVLKRRAKQAGRRLHIVNCSRDVATRCRDLGIGAVC